MTTYRLDVRIANACLSSLLPCAKLKSERSDAGLSPTEDEFLRRKESVIRGRCERELVRIVLLKDEPQFSFLCYLRAEVQYLLRSGRRYHVILQAPLTDGLEKGKNTEEVGFPGTVRANNHINRPQLQLFNRSDALETFNCDVVEQAANPAGWYPRTPAADDSG